MTPLNYFESNSGGHLSPVQLVPGQLVPGQWILCQLTHCPLPPPYSPPPLPQGQGGRDFRPMRFSWLHLGMGNLLDEGPIVHRLFFHFDGFLFNVFKGVFSIENIIQFDVG
mgnify:CR=1 FL=1